MKKLFLKLSIVVMLFMTMVSCKKDITEELEASNREALLPPSAENYYIDSIIINDGSSPRVVKFNYDVPNKKVSVIFKNDNFPFYSNVVYYKYDSNWLLESLSKDLNTIYKFNAGKFIGMKVNNGDEQFENFININLNNKPRQAISPILYIGGDVGLLIAKFTLKYTYNTTGNLSVYKIEGSTDNNQINFTYFGNVKNPFKNLKIPVDMDFISGSVLIDNYIGLNPSKFLKYRQFLPFNFTSNLLPSKMVRKTAGITNSTLNSVVNSTFLNLPVNMTISGNLPGVSGTYNANITFSYKLIQ
jgi:hypothetical protein